MKYERQTSKTNIFGIDAQISKNFELPKISWKVGKTTYSVTDIRPLNEYAVYVFEQILIQVMGDDEITRIGFKYDKDFPEDKLDLVCDILLGISFDAKSRKDGSVHGALLVSGVTHTPEDCEIVFHVIAEHAKALYQYANEHPQKEYNLLNLVEVIAEHSFQEFEKHKEDLIV